MEDSFPSPMHEEPLKLVPAEHRDAVLVKLNKGRDRLNEISIKGELNPACRAIFKGLMEHYNGNWQDVIDNHIVVRRMVLSEKDRIGIGTFQPKDEKNQDSTELTGDINYRK